MGVLSAQMADIQALQIAQSRALAKELLAQAARERCATSALRRRAFPQERTTAPPARPQTRSSPMEPRTINSFLDQFLSLADAGFGLIQGDVTFVLNALILISITLAGAQ